MDAEPRRQTKSELRKKLLTRRSELMASGSAKEKELALNELLFNWLETLSVKSVGFYSAFRSEVDISEALKRWLQQEPSRQAFLPVTQKREKPMEFLPWSEATPLKKSSFGVLQPEEGKAALPELLLVPSIALTSEGFRLGYGAGFYDRFLAAHRTQTKTAGICFSDFASVSFKADPTDIPMDFCVTEKGVRPITSER